jgi:hypothetical protein
MLWGLVGLASALFTAFITLYLAARAPPGNDSLSVTYRNNTVITVLGVPGTILACLLVDWTRKKDRDAQEQDRRPWFRLPLGGRKLTMALATILTGLFQFLFTSARSQAAVLGYNCATSLTLNAVRS